MVSGRVLLAAFVAALLVAVAVKATAAPAARLSAQSPALYTAFDFDLLQPTKPFPHYWERCVGSGHAALGLREDWRQQMIDSRQNLGWQYVRMHGVLDDDMSVMIDEQTYSFYDIDNLYDFLLGIGVRPVVELSFMPSAIASGSTTVFYYKGNTTPPKNYTQWADLVTALVSHLVDRYGLAEIQQWYFEVWNEPNCGFWNATIPEYFHLLQVTTEAVHAVHPSLKVGGPATCESGLIPETMAFVRQNNVSIDFISTHEYPTEPNRRSSLPGVMARTRELADGLPVLYTEYNSGLYWQYPEFPNHDLPFAAAFTFKNVHDCQGLVDMMSYWTFSDVFEEGGMDPRPFHNGYGMNTVIGVPKPAYRAFEILHQIGEEEVAGSMVGPNTTVTCYAVRNDSAVTVLCANFIPYPMPIDDVAVEIRVCGLSHAPQSATVRYIDDKHGSARPVWEAMGSPTYPTADQQPRIMQASWVIAQPQPLTMQGSCAVLPLDLMPYGSAAVTLVF